MLCTSHEIAVGEINMKATYIFPIILIILDIGAAIVNLYNKEYKMAIYWIAAAVLNATVTF